MVYYVFNLFSTLSDLKFKAVKFLGSVDINSPSNNCRCEKQSSVACNLIPPQMIVPELNNILGCRKTYSNWNL